MSSDAHLLSLDSVIAQSANVIEAEVDGEVVALNVERGTCYGLNNIGSRIWRLIDRPARIRELCIRLISEYEVDLPTCEAQVLELMNNLRAEDLIEVREAVVAQT